MKTIQIITYNNENTIENLIKSIILLNFDIYIIDVGSTDNTISICKRYNTTIQQYNNIKNYSKLRNDLTRSGKNLYFEPWEELISGHDIIESLEVPARFQVVEDKVITKPIRFWTDNYKFVNPIYETIKCNAIVTDVLVLSRNGNKPNEEEIINTWSKEKPTNPDPYYYKAFLKIKNNEYKEYESLVSQAMFIGLDEISSIMSKYYLAYIQLYKYKNHNNSIKNALECIVANPMMAEFWCILGDNYYSMKDYEKALSFYENAIIIGKKRLKYDLWPTDLRKYKEYPEKMKESCSNIIANSKGYTKNE